jgi:hypothetical protein
VAGVEPEPFHAPIGHSDEVFPVSHRWRYLALAVSIVGAAAVAVALRP